MTQRTSLARRLTLAISLLTALSVILAAGTTGWLALRTTSQTQEDNLAEQFQAIAEARRTSLTTRLDNDVQLLLTLANGRMTQEAAWGFRNPYLSYRYEVPSEDTGTLRSGLREWYREAYIPFSAQQQPGHSPSTDQWVDEMAHEALILQKYYWMDNPDAPAHPAALEDKADATIYGQQHRRYQASFRNIVERFGYSDLMLVDASSLAVTYSVNKGPVFATSLRNGPFRHSGLAELVNSLSRDGQSEVVMSGFSHSVFHHGRLTAYMAVPVRHPAHSPDSPVAFLVAAMPASLMNTHINADGDWQSLGLGFTGETFLTDSQGQTLTDIRSDYDEIRQLPAARLALAGNTGQGIHEDQGGRPMFTAWMPVETPGQRFALITRQSLDEVHAGLRTMRQNVWISVLLGALLLTGTAAVAAWWLSRRISRPLRNLSDRIRRASDERDITARFRAESDDEIGDMADALNGLFTTLDEALGIINETTGQAAQTARDNAEIALQTRSTVGSQQSRMQEADRDGNEMVLALEEFNTKLADSSARARQTRQIAANGETRMNSMVSEIGKLAAQIDDSCHTMQELQQASNSVFAVLETIRGVADQTNLLALNAAIEAARAGAHGRGFAVVADEVRRLSGSTQAATRDIEVLIATLQQRTRETVEGLNRENEAAQRCIEASRSTEQVLNDIGARTHGVSETLEQLEMFSSREKERMQCMQQSLAEATRAFNEADRTIARLADSAQQQLQHFQATTRATSTLTLGSRR